MNQAKHFVDHVTTDDFSDFPKRFEQDHVNGVARHWNWGIFWVEGDDNPRYFQRSCLRDQYSSGNIIKLGKGPFGLQTGEHHDDLAQKGIPTMYRQISSDPEIWGQDTEDPLCRVHYSADEIYIKEADVFEIHAKPLPYALFAHRDSNIGNAYGLTHMMFEGTYEGKKMRGMGTHDWGWQYKDWDYEEVGLDNPEALKQKNHIGDYAIGVFSGIREDGRMEHAYGAIGYGAQRHVNGIGTGVYWIEGEEPIVTEDVFLYAKWERLPYCTGDDTTVAYKEAVWRIGPKTIHYHGEWGSKGHTFNPRMAAVGFSHSGYGDWYEGETPYRHKLYHSNNENVGAEYDNFKNKFMFYVE